MVFSTLSNLATTLQVVAVAFFFVSVNKLTFKTAEKKTGIREVAEHTRDKNMKYSNH